MARRKLYALRNDRGACSAINPNGGNELALDILIARPPDRRAGNALKFDRLGAGRRPDAMQHRQQDADGHPLLDRQRHNCKRSRDDQQKLGPASPPHVAHHADANETYCDEEKDARQRGGRQMGERFAREQENADRRRGRNQSRKLRPAARLRDDGRRRRACVHGKGADETTQGVGRSDADEIPVDVGAFRAVGERRASSPLSAPSPRAR